MEGLACKNAIVTGARRGIGKAIVKELAREGVNVWACASKYDEEFEHDVNQLGGGDHWVKPVYFDLHSEEEIKSACQTIIGEKKPIDILINDAGISGVSTMHMTTAARLREVMEINFFSQIMLTQIVSKAMIRRKTRGCIINMGSVSGIEATEGYLAYGASKAAFLYATSVMAKELSYYGIRVNAVAPGLINTDIIAYKSQEDKQKIIDATDLRRIGKPEEVARVVCFLASDAASFITGETIRVDGGWSV